MGTDTYGYLPNVTRQQLFDFVKIIDLKASMDPSSLYKEISTMNFTFKGEKRNMNAHDIIIDVEKDEIWHKKKYKKEHESESWSYVKQDKLPDKSKGLWLSMGCWGSSIALMKIFCSYFKGGYINERDTDDKPFYKFRSKKRNIITFVIGESLNESL